MREASDASQAFLFDEEENDIYDESTGPTRWTRTYIPFNWTGDLEVMYR